MAGDNKKVRIKDIARLAGVSAGTVDRVLHNRGQVTDENRDRILEIVSELNYQPNLLARSLANKKNYVFATLCPEFSTSNDYWKAPDLGIDKAAREIGDYNIQVVRYYFNQFEGETFLRETQKILDLKPDGVILSPVFRAETIHFVKSLESKKIPYVFIDSNIEDLNHLTYLGQNSFQSGFLAARMLHYALPAGAVTMIVRIGGVEISNQSAHREEGIRNYYNSFGDISRLCFVNFNPEDAKSLAEFRNMLELVSPAGIIITNSKAYEVAHVLKQMGKQDVRMIGYDLLPGNIDFLWEGYILFLIAQRPEYQGYKGVMTLFESIVLKQNIEKNNYLPIDILTRENINYYLNHI